METLFNSSVRLIYPKVRDILPWVAGRRWTNTQAGMTDRPGMAETSPLGPATPHVVPEINGFHGRQGAPLILQPCI